MAPLLPSYDMIMGLILNGETVKAREHIRILQETSLTSDQESAALKEQVKSLQQKLELRLRLRLEQGLYWLRGEAPRNGPFCPRCYELDGKMVHLDGVPSKELSGNFRGLAWECKQCKAFYAVG